MSKALRILQGSFGRVALLEMAEPLVVHAHSQCHVLLKSNGADSVFRVRRQDYPLVSNTAVLVNAWEPHAYVHLDSAPRSIILALYIEPFWLSAIDLKFRKSGNPRFFPVSCVSISPLIRHLADRLAEEMLSDGKFAERTLESLMCEIICRFSSLGSADQGSKQDSMYSDYRIRKAIQFRVANPVRWRKSHELARESGLSRSHFFEMFRRSTMLTPGVYFNALRMETAIVELSKGESAIGQVSSGLGFSAQSHFTRFFRHHLGITPSEFRRVVDIVAH